MVSTFQPGKRTCLHEVGVSLDYMYTPTLLPTGLVSRGLSFQRYGSRTVRKSLDVLSRQCEYVQRERDELQKSLISREREIASLLR